MDSTLQLIIFDRTNEQGRIRWQGKRLLIGRRPDADIRVDEPTMSGIHAEIVPVQEGALIRDLDSLNGTRLNGVRITEALLHPGDQIQIGRARIVATTPRLAAETDEETVDTVPGGREDRPRTSSGIETVLSPDGQNTQTVKIRLEQLKGSRGEDLQEDERILLLRDLFENLQGEENQRTILSKTRQVLDQAFHRARVFVLERTGHGWSDPEVGGAQPPSMTFVEETVQGSSAVLSTSLPEDQRFSASESARISGITTAIAAPTTRDGVPVAVIYVDRLGLPPFSMQDLSILGIAANHVSAVLENASRIGELRRTNAELEEARENLAELNKNLEQLVEDRTAEIRRQAEEIQRLADAKDELMGIAAHDIRGPLTVIQGTAELLRLRDMVDDATLDQSLEMIHGAARGLSRLLSELLDAKAIESGRIELRRRRASVEELLETALPAPRLAADDKNIALVTEIEVDLVAYADPQRLAQAITNLVLNAVKFSDTGSRILLRATGDGAERLELSVEDQGIGIPEAELEKIFGSFEQGEVGRQYGGSGLGLMIARRLVDLHEGQLTVESQVGVGSRFVMRIPKYRGQPEARAPEGEGSEAPGAGLGATPPPTGTAAGIEARD